MKTKLFIQQVILFTYPGDFFLRLTQSLWDVVGLKDQHLFFLQVDNSFLRSISRIRLCPLFYGA